jgi:hypothetical protein
MGSIQPRQNADNQDAHWAILGDVGGGMPLRFIGAEIRQPPTQRAGVNWYGELGPRVAKFVLGQTLGTIAAMSTPDQGEAANDHV